MKTTKRVVPVRSLRDEMIGLLECAEFDNITNEHATKIRKLNMLLRYEATRLTSKGKPPSDRAKLACLACLKLIYHLWHLKTTMKQQGADLPLADAAYRDTKKEVEGIITVYEKEMNID